MRHARKLDGLASLQLLAQAFDDPLSATLFVALDIESSPKGISELGISTFDPSCLLHLRNDSQDSLDSKITTFYYAKGASKYCHRYKPYRLGMPQQYLHDDDLPQILDTHLSPTTTDGKLRKVVLIGHSIDCDLRFFMQFFKIDLAGMSNIEAILDTQVMARLIPQSPDRPSLKRVLQDLQLDYTGLHNAGHDARYTLRAALMLFVTCERQNDPSNSVIPLLEGIARSHKINKGRKWTTPTRTKIDPSPDIFSLDAEDGGILALLCE